MASDIIEIIVLIIQTLWHLFIGYIGMTFFVYLACVIFDVFFSFWYPFIALMILIAFYKVINKNSK